MGLQILPVDTLVKEGLHGNIIFFLIQVVHQIHQHLFGAAMLQIGDQEQDFLFHISFPQKNRPM